MKKLLLLFMLMMSFHGFSQECYISGLDPKGNYAGYHYYEIGGLSKLQVLSPTGSFNRIFVDGEIYNCGKYVNSFVVNIADKFNDGISSIVLYHDSQEYGACFLSRKCDFELDGLFYAEKPDSEEIGVVGYNYDIKNNDIIINDEVTYKLGNKIVTWIAPWALKNSKCTSIKLSSRIEQINEGAFMGCANLERIEIPSSVLNIGVDAFDGCSSLSELILQDGGYINIEVKKGKRNAFEDCRLKYAYLGQEISIWNSSPSPFTGLKYLDFIEFGSEVKHLPKGLFKDCKSLSSITIPSNIKSINPSVFSGCESLTSVQFLNSFDWMMDSLFYNCSALENIEIPNGVTSIMNDVFNGCTSLSEIILPRSVSSIGNGTFNNCTKLSKVTSLNLIPPMLNGDVFDNYNAELYVPGLSLNDYKQANGWNNFSWVRPIPGTELISFNEDTVTITSGETYKLTVTTIPEDATVSWTSSNSECVIVNSEGVISGIKGGTAVVTASIYEDKKAECVVTVRQGANELKFDIHDLSLRVGEEYKIKTTILPENTFDKTIKWSSSNNSVANIDEDGNIVALKAGTAIIKGSMNKIANDSCKVVVIQPAESISLQTTAEMYIGTSLRLTATVLPEDVTDNTVTWSTSDAAIATVDTEGNVTAVAVGEATITATCGDKSATCNVTVNPILAESIALDKTELNLTIGASEKLTATVLPEDVTDKTVTWSTSDASIATVDNEGNVTAVAVGEATITATCGDKTATCKVTVNPILAESITLDKTELTLTIGASEKLTATVLPEDVSDKTVTWSTSDASIATVDAEGNVKAISVGEATITATCGDKSATCKVTVNPILAESITLDKTELTLTIGASEKLTAIVLPEDVTDKTVTWSTSDAAIATVDNEGNVTAVAVGEATITATCGDKTATCEVTVNPILAESITLDKTELTLTIGASEKLTATVLPEEVTDKTVTWSTSDAAIATVDTEGNVTAISVGEATITATCGDKSATCKVTVNPILAESITLDKTELTLTIGASEKLTPTVLPEDVTDKTVTWSTSDASIATVDAEGNVKAISVGEATITATCGDKSATCKVTVNPILAESISLDKTELTLTIGETEKLTATVLPEDVTDKTVTWSTSDATIATVDAEGNVKAISVGEATITATCGDKSATCKVTVNPILAESITLDKTELTLTIGASEKLTAIVLPEDVTDKTVTWSTSDAAIATVDTEGNVTAISVGEAVITATCGEISTSCRVIVEKISGIVFVSADDINIVVNGNELTIKGATSEDKVTIVRQDGAVIYSGNNRESYTLVRGLYIILVNDATYKVVIN